MAIVNGTSTLLQHRTTRVIHTSWVQWWGPYMATKVPITHMAGATYPTMEGAIEALDPFQNGSHATWPMSYVPRVIERYATVMEDIGHPLPGDWAIGCKCYGCNRAFLGTLEFQGEWDPKHDDGRI